MNTDRSSPSPTRRPVTANRATVAFVMEQHLGHRTFADNLRTSLPADIDLDVRWVPVTYSAAPPLPGPLARLAPTSVVSALAGRAEVRRGIDATRADVVVCNTQVPAALGGRVVRSRPYVVITDVTPVQYDRMADGYGHRVDSTAAVRWWKHRLNLRVFREATACVGWSSWVCGSLRDDYGVAAERTHVIPPGVDTTVWKPRAGSKSDGPFTVLFVGGEFGRKGGDTLLDAFARLPESSRLVLVTRSAPPHLGSASDRIQVIDDLHPNDSRLVELYAMSDVFALPSHAETFGIAAVEASASGVPVVATCVGGFSDIVDEGTTGLLVPPADPAALAAALGRFAADRALCDLYGGRARERAIDRFDARRNVERLIEVVRDVVP
jgi:glycosyltransferase involved in cell wall biosynthesis